MPVLSTSHVYNEYWQLYCSRFSVEVLSIHLHAHLEPLYPIKQDSLSSHHPPSWAHLTLWSSLFACQNLDVINGYVFSSLIGWLFWCFFVEIESKPGGLEWLGICAGLSIIVLVPDLPQSLTICWNCFLLWQVFDTLNTALEVIPTPCASALCQDLWNNVPQIATLASFPLIMWEEHHTGLWFFSPHLPLIWC